MGFGGNGQLKKREKGRGKGKAPDGSEAGGHGRASPSGAGDDRDSPAPVLSGLPQPEVQQQLVPRSSGKDAVTVMPLQGGARDTGEAGGGETHQRGLSGQHTLFSKA